MRAKSRKGGGEIMPINLTNTINDYVPPTPKNPVLNSLSNLDQALVRLKKKKQTPTHKPKPTNQKTNQTKPQNPQTNPQHLEENNCGKQSTLDSESFSSGELI